MRHDDEEPIEVAAEKRTNIRRAGAKVFFDYRGVEILDHSDVVNFGLMLRKWPRDVKRLDISIANVKFLPSGFFGVLLDGVEMGFEVRLLNARPEIQRLIGYQNFVTRGVVHL